MSAKSKIEWTDDTWNPVSGCTKVSPGCKFCYAETFAERFRGKEGHYYEGGFDLQLRPAMLEEPLRWRKPRIIFVNSMSDLFHEDIPDEYILKMFEVMRQAHWHTFQALTKRSERMVELCRSIDIPSNVWLGVSIELMECRGRVDDLRRVNTPNRFLSCEPLLGPLDDLDLTGIAWVIGGGESGSHLVRHQERRLDNHPEWIRGLRDICERAGVPFHFKQWGGHRKRLAGRVLDGRTHDAVPGRTVVRLPIVTDLHAGFSSPDVKPIKVKDPKRVAAAHKAWVTMRQREVVRPTEARFEKTKPEPVTVIWGPDRRAAAHKAWRTMRTSVAVGSAKPKGVSEGRVLSLSLDSIVESANRALFRGELTPVTISYGDPPKAAGHYDPESQEIVVREGRSPRDLLATVVHELCHHATRFRGTAHGQAWQRKMIEIGLMPHGTPRHFSQSEIPGGMFQRWADSL